HSAEAAADDGVLAVDVIGEPDSRAEIERSIRFHGLEGAPERSEVETRIEQTVQIPEAGGLGRILGLSGVASEGVVANSQVDDEFLRGAPVILDEESELVHLRVVAVVAELELEAIRDIRKEVRFVG